MHTADQYVAEVIPPTLWKRLRARLQMGRMYFVSQFRSHLDNLIDWSQIEDMNREPIWWSDLKDVLTIDGSNFRPEFAGLRAEDAVEFSSVSPAILE